MGQKLNLPGLIIHDKDDSEADYEQALFFDEMWPQGKLISTKGLGHSRILRDDKVIDKIIGFVSIPQNDVVESVSDNQLVE